MSLLFCSVLCLTSCGRQVVSVTYKTISGSTQTIKSHSIYKYTKVFLYEDPQIIKDYKLLEEKDISFTGCELDSSHIYCDVFGSIQQKPYNEKQPLVRGWYSTKYNCFVWYKSDAKKVADHDVKVSFSGSTCTITYCSGGHNQQMVNYSPQRKDKSITVSADSVEINYKQKD